MLCELQALWAQEMEQWGLVLLFAAAAAAAELPRKLRCLDTLRHQLRDRGRVPSDPAGEGESPEPPAECSRTPRAAVAQQAAPTRPPERLPFCARLPPTCPTAACQPVPEARGGPVAQAGPARTP